MVEGGTGSLQCNEGGSDLQSSRKDIVLLGVLFLIALAVRLYFLQFLKVITADGTGYANIAREIMGGKGFGSAIHFPPFYPVLIGLMNLIVPDIELAGRLVSIIMGSLIVVPIYLLSVEFFNREVGLIAGIITISWPSIRVWSCEVMSQATYITTILMGIYLTWLAFKKRSNIFVIAAGLFMSLSYLTRPEAIIVYAATTVVLLAYGLICKVPWKWLATFILTSLFAFSLLSLPYISLVHKETGVWQVTGKTQTGLYHALGEYYGKVDLYNEANLPKIGLLDIFRDHPDFLKYKISTNLKLTYEMVPPYIWIFAFLGFFSGGWNKVKVMERSFLLSTFTPFLLLISVFFISPEYTQLYFPILFLWSTNGILWVEEGILRKITGTGRLLWLKKISASVSFSGIIVAILSVSILIDQVPADRNKPYHFAQDGGRYDHKRIGLLLNKKLPKGAKIMTRWGRIAFYADREWVMIPTTRLPDVIETAKKNGVKYIVVDGMVVGMRPELELLSKPLFSTSGIYSENEYMPVPGLKLILLYRHPTSVGVAVYEIME